MSMIDILQKSTGQAFATPSKSTPASKLEETKVDEPHTSEPKPETSQESAHENVGVSNSNDEPREVSAESVASTDTSETSSSASPGSAPIPEDKPPKKERKKREKRQPTTEPWKRFSCECSVALTDKLHNICNKEHVSLRSLVEKMFRDGIRSYERKHGVAEGATKRTAEDLY